MVAKEHDSDQVEEMLYADLYGFHFHWQSSNMSTRRGDAKDEDALRLPLAVGVRMNSTHFLSRPFSFQLV
jgi:hypothetical protein